jgi:hypothetical protein
MTSMWIRKRGARVERPELDSLEATIIHRPVDLHIAFLDYPRGANGL